MENPVLMNYAAANPNPEIKNFQKKRTTTNTIIPYLF
jgi:hypothetical protein